MFLTTHRHWSVFAAGTALILIIRVITPLQSSLLTITPVARDTRTKLTTVKLWAYGNQAGKLDSFFLYSAYDMTWLGSAPVEIDFVALPFFNFIIDAGEPRIISWTGVTRAYQTHIDCVPAMITELGKNSYSAYNFTTDNCFYVLNPLPDESATRNLIYIGHGNNNDTTQRHLRESECPVKNIFLGVWAKSSVAHKHARA